MLLYSYCFNLCIHAFFSGLLYAKAVMESITCIGQNILQQQHTQSVEYATQYQSPTTLACQAHALLIIHNKVWLSPIFSVLACVRPNTSG